MDGFINLLKPVGPTSSQAVGWVKRITGEKKAGHTGTLDPGAAGVLPVCLGRATKLSEMLTKSNKAYRAEITFGVVTDTQDSFGKVLCKTKAEVSKEGIIKLLKGFRGAGQQVPPMYSAIKQGGRKLYQLAREGLEVERKPRSIKIYSLELVEFFSPDRAIIDIVCSKGTYIRTLCHDIGVKSGYGAIMSFLVRLNSGGFKLETAVTLEELEKAAKKGSLPELILPIDYPLQDMARTEIREDSLRFALNGNPLYPHNFRSDIRGLGHGQTLRLYYRQTLIGLGVYLKDGQSPQVRMKCMLTGARVPGDFNKQM
ncbi:MAG: tRNA pseudouridine(55) synthase TruB [Bacillota bacterium]|jgi:tRNA pseudouridine55 synthase|nr:tRNA pseudouridine(55) synthase TruB [Bacillota bacterium]MDD3297289.1 tRNA pseudouridine(55) synthase TruB [Bacillota bacterium]MDD3850790.1 tRNA pseudouridine(55) synthase TruB [Bacillota bacterium]MDD4706805.1 tRNA pseudouridine(55) synthase TruB [Bacillota bacterium]